VAFSYTDFYTTLYFVNQRNYKTLAMQAHALTRKRYFYSLNVIISHPTVQSEGLGYLSVCAIALRSSPPSHVCICNGQRSSELFCVHCRATFKGMIFVLISCGMESWYFSALQNIINERCVNPQTQLNVELFTIECKLYR
jgi:hypothetical protein